MDLAALVPPGATASRSLVVTEELTVGHWAEGMHVRGLVDLARFESRWRAKAAAAGETRPGTLTPPGARP
ncbi:MAG: hypothetical protein U0529_01105 [Thermoanaerobaculia bacterium]